MRRIFFLFSLLFFIFSLPPPAFALECKPAREYPQCGREVNVSGCEGRTDWTDNHTINVEEYREDTDGDGTGEGAICDYVCTDQGAIAGQCRNPPASTTQFCTVNSSCPQSTCPAGKICVALPGSSRDGSCEDEPPGYTTPPTCPGSGTGGGSTLPFPTVGFGPPPITPYLPLVTHPPPGPVCPGNVCKTAIGDVSTDARGFINTILKLILGVAGGVALLLIIFSGYRMMTSAGNPEALQGARETLTSAIVGLLFIIFSLVLLQIIGVDILKIPGFEK